MKNQGPFGGMSPNLRVTQFFFAQSLSVGLANSFAGIWFGDQGLTPGQIGVINAAPVVLLLLTTLFVGRLADRAADWRQVIIIGAAASAVFPIGLFWAQEFVPILLFWTLAVVAQWAIVPVADAAALRMARRSGGDFGKFRAWGTIGYLLVIFLAGYLIDAASIEIFLPLFVGLCLIRAAAAFGLPKMRDEPDAEQPRETMTNLKQTLQPWFLLPLLGWALIYSTHLVLNAFQGLLWSQQGLPTNVIGNLIGLGALAETAMFFGFRHLAKRISALHMILLAALMSVIRWSAMSMGPGVEVLVVLQLLHSVTYALGFLACTNFIADSTSEDMAAQGQSLLVVLEQGLAIFVLLGFGWLAGFWGAGAYLASAGIAGLGGIFILLAMRLKSPTPG
ncbi:MAG: MFS transporter [Marinosulfonomonas sp.]